MTFSEEIQSKALLALMVLFLVVYITNAIWERLRERKRRITGTHK